MSVIQVTTLSLTSTTEAVTPGKDSNYVCIKLTPPPPHHKIIHDNFNLIINLIDGYCCP